MKKIVLSIIIILGFLLGMLGNNIWGKSPSFVRPVSWNPETQWITFPTPTHQIYARHTFNINSPEVKTAWLKISADNNFIIYANGLQIARQLSQTTSSLPLAHRRRGFLETQYINDSLNYQVRSENRQIAYPRNWKLSYYLDISHWLKPGENVIAVEVEKARQDPRVVIEGEIELFDQESPRINLSTGVASWKVNNLFGNQQDVLWYQNNFFAQNWQEAKKIGPVTESTYSRLSQNLYSLDLQGNWITGKETSKGEIWLQSNWQISDQIDRAFIRFAGKAEKSIIVNGNVVAHSPREKQQLHMYEVTNFLHQGQNTVTIHLANSLEPSLKINPNLFYLDGWVETKANNVTDIFTTDENWISLNQAPKNLTKLSEKGENIFLFQKPVSTDFIWRSFDGNAYLNNYYDYFWRFVFWGMGGVFVTIIFAWLLGHFYFKNNLNGDVNKLTQGTVLLMPSTFYLIGVGLLKHRYAESERGLLFAQSQTNLLILLGFLAIILLSMLWSQLSTSPQQNKLRRWFLWFCWGMILLLILAVAETMMFSSYLIILFLCLGLATVSITPWWWKFQSMARQNWSETFFKIWNSWGSWFLFSVIILVGFFLRVYDLDGTPRDSDENTSLDAIRSILETKAPILTSGIWYTRGPFFHYLVALWLRIVGFSTVNGRFLMAIFGTLTLVVLFFFCRKITGKTWIALVVIALLAIDPWELAVSRNTRFYQLLQFTTIVSFWFFYKGFIYQEKQIYKYLFLVTMTLSLITQEGVGLMQIPIFVVGFLYFYRPFRWSVDWQLVLTSLFLFSIYYFDLIFFRIKCMTLPVGVSSGSSSPVGLRFYDITGFTKALLIGNSRFYVIYGLFFVLGFVYFLLKRDSKLIFLFISVLIFLADTTLLILQVSARYTYCLFPIMVMLSVYSAFSIMGELGRKAESISQHLLPVTTITIAYTALILFFNIEPNRVIASYQDTLARNNPALFEYIRQNQEPGDLIMANLPSAAAIALNKLDYHSPRRDFLSLDGYYKKDGVILDRWAGGQVIFNLDQLQDILAKGQRVWIQLDDRLRPNRSNPLKIYEYLNTVGKTVFQSYGVTLRLWQPEDGYLPKHTYEGKDLGDF